MNKKCIMQQSTILHLLDFQKSHQWDKFINTFVLALPDNTPLPEDFSHRFFGKEYSESDKEEYALETIARIQAGVSLV